MCIPVDMDEKEDFHDDHIKPRQYDSGGPLFQIAKK